MKSTKWSLILSLGILPLGAAAEESTADKSTEASVLETVQVIGDTANVATIPGSATLIGTEDIRTQSYSDINRILRRVPGVYVREEDGYGLFPNISLRGVDTSRSAKVTLMEDGVLTAPAPYSAPAAYFTPSAGRMSGIEVLKGSSQIQYGPHITGGVVNYLSTPIPETGKAYLKALYGSYNEIRTHGFVGKTVDTDLGRFGYVLEGFFRETDGFKRIDKVPDFNDRDQTGFTQIEPMIKIMWEPKTDIYQRLEAKFGYSNLQADETYLGLSETDFEKDPFRRYSSSRFDNISTNQYRTYLRYFVSPTDNLDLITTGYYSQFHRNWFKLNDLRNIPGVGNMDLSSALGGAENGQGLACLKGQLECTLRVRNNDRSYYLWGIEQKAVYRMTLGDTYHQLSGGFRYHEDQVQRNQLDELFSQNADGVIFDRTKDGPRGKAGERTQHTKAYAFFLQDRIEWGKWGFTPGIRYEHVIQDLKDNNSPQDNGSNTLDLFAGGGGVDYTFNNEWMAFASAHRGFSPPSPRSAVRDGLDEETSTAWELGVRYNKGPFSAEVVGFYTQFENLIVINNIGGTGTGDTENFGEVDSRGVEMALNFDAGSAFDWGFSNPYFVSFTYTNAIQNNDAQSTDPGSIFSFGKQGNKVPYIPEYAVSFGTGLHFNRWGIDLTGNYVGETFTSANNTTRQINGAGEPDARFGKTDDYLIFDVAAYYQVSDKIRVLGGVQNFTNREYLVSRQPHGPRPGMPLFAYGGFEMEFGI
ncbi:MAG: TonB-dependent receptor [Methylohalobius crimeensis]